MDKTVYLLLLTASIFLTGCAASSKPIYQWGNYETLVYQSYLKEGEVTPADQATQLAEHIQQVHAADAKVPPGVHAHLGYLRFLQGKQSLARAEFKAEKNLYPESAKLVDGLIKGLEQAE